MARPFTTPGVYIGGRPMQSMGLWGDLHITDRWPYGCWEMTWGVVLKRYQRIPWLVPGARVEARVASGLRWVGTLGQPDWDSGQMTAFGLARQAESAVCLDSALKTTSVPDTAIDQAIARQAVSWIRRTSLSSTALAVNGVPVTVSYLTALLDAWAKSTGGKWAVNPLGEVYAAADPTVPSLSIRPGAGELGLSDVNLAGRIFGAYQDLTGAYVTTSVGSGVPEAAVDLLSYGPITAATALGVLGGIQTKIQPKATWSNGLTVAADQVSSMGGQNLGLEQVVAGKMARLLGVRDQRGVLVSQSGMSYSDVNPSPVGIAAYTDIVMAQTEWDVTGGTVAVAPANMDDETLSGAVEDAGGQLL
jgi:hypothetical protein